MDFEKVSTYVEENVSKVGWENLSSLLYEEIFLHNSSGFATFAKE